MQKESRLMAWNKRVLAKHHIGKKSMLSFLLILYAMAFVPMSICTVKFPAFMGGYIDFASMCLSFIPMLVGDILVECYGTKKAMKIGAVAYLVQLFLAAIIAIYVAIPGTDGYVDECVATVLGTNWRFVVFGTIAYYAGTFTNDAVMGVLGKYWKKKGTDNGFKLFVRAIGSTLVGQILDNFIFAFFAFAPWGWTAIEMSYGSIFSYIGCVTAFEVGIEMVLYVFTRYNTRLINQLPQVYDNDGNVIDFRDEK